MVAILIFLGGIQQLRGQNFVIFDPPSPLRGQKEIFDLLPPHLVHVVIKCPQVKKKKKDKAKKKIVLKFRL